jgi:hypothetical protein
MLTLAKLLELEALATEGRALPTVEVTPEELAGLVAVSLGLLVACKSCGEERRYHVRSGKCVCFES